MKLSLPFQEITCYVKQHFGYTVDLKCISAKTVELAYSHAAFLPTIRVSLHIFQISSDSIVIGYEFHCILGIGKIIEHFIASSSWLKEKLRLEKVQLLKNKKQVYVHLDDIRKLDKLFEYVDLHDLTFTPKEAQVHFSLLGPKKS